MSEDIHDLSVVAAKSDEGNVPENLHSIATTKYIFIKSNRVSWSKNRKIVVL